MIDATEQPNEKYLAAKQKAAARRLHEHEAAHPKVGEAPDRLPPGQHTVAQMRAMPPIYGAHPEVSREAWRLQIDGTVAKPVTLDWAGLGKLLHKEYTVDFHCVTSWSKLDQVFTGIPFRTLVELVAPTAATKHVIFSCADTYTTNVVYQELLDHEAFLAIAMDGQSIVPEYGGPARMVIPHLYGWKSAKYVAGIHFQAEDAPGFWETRGYHNHADPWSEERYS